MILIQLHNVACLLKQKLNSNLKISIYSFYVVDFAGKFEVEKDSQIRDKLTVISLESSSSQHEEEEALDSKMVCNLMNS